jgi:hypothetical protein
MKATTTRRRAPKTPSFTISLSVGEVHYEGQGATPELALLALAKPPKVFIKGILRISNGAKVRTLAYSPLQIKRLFYPMARKVIAKQLSVGMI